MSTELLDVLRTIIAIISPNAPEWYRQELAARFDAMVASGVTPAPTAAVSSEPASPTF